MTESMKQRYRSRLEEKFPPEMRMILDGEEIVYEKALSLRYGENPHQPAALYTPKDARLTIGNLRELKTGKSGLSQTNIEDVNNAVNILKYFDEPACAVMKHLNPSGVAAAEAQGASLREVYVRARDCDGLAAFGGVVGFNAAVDVETAREVTSTFMEVVAAPGYEEKALDVFSRKKDLRVLQFGDIEGLSRFVGDARGPYAISVLLDGSIILSTQLLTKVRSAGDVRTVTKRTPTPIEMADMIFSWYVCMNVRSNGVVVSKGRTTLGIGTGQQDRVTAVRLALEKAVERGHGDEVKGAVLASDGFFPFSDSVELMGKYGVSACIQPGGSVKDAEVIEACDGHGIAMVFTNERCFRHF
jgi:phosphoribosylaminoimidazolecarboxamide formyltransferase/IMP cyclohydrolase